MNARIRVLVIEDSLTVRKRLEQAIDADPELICCGTAQDGVEAIALCQTLRPDVVSLDIVLPGMSGLSVTEFVMAHCPTPILIVSSEANRGDAFKTYDALAAGAVDVLEKPRPESDERTWSAAYTSRLRLLSRIPVVTRHARRRPAVRHPAAEDVLGAANPASRPRAIAIGTSTGGPAALIQLFNGLRPKFPIPILLTVHLARGFTTVFDEWLSGETSQRVRFARDGEPLPPRGPDAKIFVAPPSSHLVVEGGRLKLTYSPPRHSCIPSVDELFDSVARELGPHAVGCLLTGMGTDGATGLLAMRTAGAQTYAQDEKSSVIFGMPRAAIELNAAREVLPLNGFAPMLNRLIETGE
ncbi:MAG: chemotaxis-specific protein-glutamate methyltransferase CheB [Actinomycetia bacterium]|nr:chemotaxis-specific protein-glutamate methyltransferase CheB [Actinomycetes bacterium]